MTYILSYHDIKTVIQKTDLRIFMINYTVSLSIASVVGMSSTSARLGLPQTV